MARPRRPWGAFLSATAAAILAAPTLIFPADSPTEPKLVFLAIGAGILIGAIVRIRAEGFDRDTASRDERVTEE